MAQVVEGLFSKCKTLSSNSSTYPTSILGKSYGNGVWNKTDMNSKPHSTIYYSYDVISVLNLVCLTQIPYLKY
jgi:hypothetical protein